MQHPENWRSGVFVLVREDVACWIMLLACLNKSTANVDWKQSFRCSKRLDKVTGSIHLWLILSHIVSILILYGLRVSLADSGNVHSHHRILHRPFVTRVTSSRDLTFVIGGPAIVVGWPAKGHKVVYVLVIGLHLSHWVTHHSHCVARLSHWAAHHSHWVAHRRLGVPTEVLGKDTIIDGNSGYCGNIASYISVTVAILQVTFRLLWQYCKLHCCTVDCLSVLRQRKVLGKLYKMENPTM
jgi:hypothetical protein